MDCVKCGNQILEDEGQYTIGGQLACQDCYYREFGEEVERGSIVNPTRQGLPASADCCDGQLLWDFAVEVAKNYNAVLGASSINELPERVAALASQILARMQSPTPSVTIGQTATHRQETQRHPPEIGNVPGEVSSRHHSRPWEKSIPPVDGTFPDPEDVVENIKPNRGLRPKDCQVDLA